MTEALSRVDVRIAELDPADEAAVRASYDILRATQAHDIPDLAPPCEYGYRAGLRTPWPGHLALRYLALSGERAVGCLLVDLTTLDNLDNAYVEIAVLPQERRRGVGRALHQHAVSVAQREGRKRIMADTVTTLGGGPERDEAGSAFAAAVGAAGANREVRRKLEVSTVDWPSLDRVVAQAWIKAAGYSVVLWTDHTPPEYIDDVGLLHSRLIEDAPSGDLAWEPEKIDADRVRATDQTRQLYGSRQFAAGLRHDATGRIVAITALIKEHSIADHLWQGITLVHPAHRGHRLGTIAKIENLRHAVGALPDVRHIDTWNAAVNDHMISINEAMGFQTVDLWISWQQDVGRQRA